MPITRITLFKVPVPEHRERILAKYRTLGQEALKDGKPYIRSLRAGETVDDQRRQGFTIAVVSEFESLEDMNYYDTECQGHAGLKAVAKDLIQGILTTYFEPSVTSG